MGVKNGFIDLYTQHPKDYWQQCLTAGKMLCDPGRITDDFETIEAREFHNQHVGDLYSWMSSQMRLRLPDCHIDHYPMWAYLSIDDLLYVQYGRQYDDTHQRYNPSDELAELRDPQNVVVHCRVPINRVLLSHYWAWNSIYPFGGMVCLTRRDVARWNRHSSEYVLPITRPTSPEHKPLFDTWSHIFDIDKMRRSQLWSRRNSQTLQATLEEINLDEVIDVKSVAEWRDIQLATIRSKVHQGKAGRRIMRRP